MQIKLTIQEKLKDLRTEKGLTLEELSEAVGISSSALGNYENNDNKDISHYSIVLLANFYNVSTDYLLGLTENRFQQHTSIEELHLSDEAIKKLKAGYFNNRLLSEMICHPAFGDFMADAEIYVDGVANMQIQNLNALVDVVKEEIIKKYNPSESDQNMRTLEAAHINEEVYFTGKIHEDADRIFSDIKGIHKNDSTSGYSTPLAFDIERDLEDISQFHGSDQEKQIVLLCKRLKIKYSKLTSEEFKTLIGIFKKSPLMKTKFSQRGKNLKQH